MSNWINKYGYVFPFGENGIVFTTEYVILLMKNSRKYEANQLTDKVIKSSQPFPNVDPKFLISPVISEPWSHDNHTAIVSLSKIMEKHIHKKSFYTAWHRRLHPRDIIYYNFLKGGLYKLLSYPFLPLLSMFMILSCRNSTKNIDGDIVQATDTKLLTWIRLNTISMPFTQKICTKLIHKHFGSWKNVFGVYFKDKEHPINNFKLESYEL